MGAAAWQHLRAASLGSVLPDIFLWLKVLGTLRVLTCPQEDVHNHPWRIAACRHIARGEQVLLRGRTG